MLTPLDIENKKFQKQMMNGYNVDEVDDFLDEITVDYEKLYKENTELRAEIEKSKSDLERYKNIEQTLQNTLVSLLILRNNLIFIELKWKLY